MDDKEIIEEYGELCDESEYSRISSYYDSISARLRTLTLSELYDRVFEGGKPIIENLLYTGAYVFAGAPKVGKSFLMGQFAYHVSTGTPLWGHKVNKGTVLYLALEDDFSRLQKRMFQMYSEGSTDNLHFCTVSAQMGTGLIEQLEVFVREHSTTSLIIIDTLQKIKEESEKEYSYTDDYKTIGELKKFADEHGICVIAVHHTRKSTANDKFEMISGTTGILGCADGAFVMTKDDRSKAYANLSVVGRDQPDMKLHLVKDMSTLCWNIDYEDDEQEERVNEREETLPKALKDLLAKCDNFWIGSPARLVKDLGMNIPANVLSRKLNVLAGMLFDKYHIKYFRRRKDKERIIELHDVTDFILNMEKEREKEEEEKVYDDLGYISDIDAMYEA